MRKFEENKMKKHKIDVVFFVITVLGGFNLYGQNYLGIDLSQKLSGVPVGIYQHSTETFEKLDTEDWNTLLSPLETIFPTVIDFGAVTLSFETFEYNHELRGYIRGELGFTEFVWHLAPGISPDTTAMQSDTLFLGQLLETCKPESDCRRAVLLPGGRGCGCDNPVSGFSNHLILRVSD